MEQLATGFVIDGAYRVESLVARSPRADVYAVTHLRFPDVSLVLKVVPLRLSADFERDTTALASATTPSVARVVDRGKLEDGRLYRVARRLSGPMLRDALARSPFSASRAMEIVVALSAAVHETHASGYGPCDVSVENLMFEDGRDGRLCMLRLLAPPGAPENADVEGLAALPALLERSAGGAWKPPSSLAEVRAALVQTGAPPPPDGRAPGDRIQRWEVVRLLGETLRSTVYEVSGADGPAILKLAGPGADHAFFKRHAQLLSRVQSRHVVRVFDQGMHEGSPFVVLEKLHRALGDRLKAEGPLPIDMALQAIDELLWGADAIERAGGAPSDFALDHVFHATELPSPAVLTHALTQHRTFRAYGRQQGESADAWSAAVALYELVAGRLPFPTSKHSLARAWMGMPVPLAQRRPELPAHVSELVQSILTGARMSTSELRRELTRIRSAPATIRPSVFPSERMQRSIVPVSVPPTPSTPRIEGITPLLPDRPRRALAEWSFEPVGAPCPMGGLLAAAFDPEGTLVAIAPDAVARFERGRWSVSAAEGSAIRDVYATRDGTFLGVSEAGLFRLDAGWRRCGPHLPRYVFRGATRDGDGMLLFGTTSDRRAGVVARLQGDTITILADALATTPLRGGARVGESSLVVVGDAGTLARVEGGEVVESLHPCEVDLLHAALVGTDVVAVGAHAWAFVVRASPLAARLEPVETTSSLGGLVAIADEAWVGSATGRILVRVDGRWRRKNPRLDADVGVLALHVDNVRVRALFADGRLLEGRPR